MVWQPAQRWGPLVETKVASMLTAALKALTIICFSLLRRGCARVCVGEGTIVSCLGGTNDCSHFVVVCAAS
jgi:hypothetical protein